jgi:hypothetical protein
MKKFSCTLTKFLGSIILSFQLALKATSLIISTKSIIDVIVALIIYYMAIMMPRLLCKMHFD